MAEREDGAGRWTEPREDRVPQVIHDSPVTQAGFTLIPNAVMMRADLTSDAKLVYGYLKHLAWRGRTEDAVTPRETIARDLCMSTSRVTNATQVLGRAPAREHDEDSPPLVVSVRRGQGFPNVYVINEPEYLPPTVQDVSLEARKAAYRIVHRATRRGTLLRMPCEICGDEQSQAHHDDYSEPLAVRWLCAIHHREADITRRTESSLLDGPNRLFPARARQVGSSKTKTQEQDKNAPQTVQNRRVSEDERDASATLLAAFNQLTESRHFRKEWVAKIVMRLREHPDLTIDDHLRVLTYSIDHPWWRGRPSPAVVYGNAALYEQRVEEERAPAADGRGMTADEIRNGDW